MLQGERESEGEEASRAPAGGRPGTIAPTREDDAGPERWVTCPRPAMVGGEAGTASQLLEPKAVRFRTSLCTNLQLTVSYILYIS